MGLVLLCGFVILCHHISSVINHLGKKLMYHFLLYLTSFAAFLAIFLGRGEACHPCGGFARASAGDSTTQTAKFALESPNHRSGWHRKMQEVYDKFRRCSAPAPRICRKRKKSWWHTKSSTSSCFIHCLYDSFGHEMRGTTARIRSSEKQSSGEMRNSSVKISCCN